MWLLHLEKYVIYCLQLKSYKIVFEQTNSMSKKDS